MKRRLLLFVPLLLVLGACADEDPTTVGGDLLSGGTVRTIETIFDASRFLEMDTAANGFTRPSLAEFMTVARRAAGTLDAHTLYRFGPFPKSVAYRTAVGDTAKVDTLPRFVSGRVVIKLDSLHFAGTKPIRLELYRTAQKWDPATATWQLAIDSIGERSSWTQPGGTPGTLVDTTTWAGTDSITFNVDSATIAAWMDTTNFARGAILVATTDGARMRLARPLLRLKARPSPRPDTLVDAVTSALETFVFDPPAPASSDLRVSGTPAWRSFLRFVQSLDTVRVGCTPTPADCVRLRDATINYAALQLKPVTTPGAFLPEDSLGITAWPVFESPIVPLTRSPLSAAPIGGLRALIPPSAFVSGSGEAVELPVTTFFANLVAQRADTAAAPTRTLALLGSLESRYFGFASFGSRENAAAAPKLRVIVTVSSQVEIR
jgi:hypothetical protein